ncbi:dTMP kinase [Synchytrium microbalum]|uniref:Thymidylate kinase n=1 Tax=Synchytrium microbalum TaxID=1806994 RepID=A0A507BXF8_9FUNG|nr:dTMP kinase [Synchytrium microbalum]TPX33477.1 dTMP kinase [Synchytrium microbalum]
MLSPTSRRGALIVFEGGDRSGKSTQAATCRDKLIKCGHHAVLLRYPDRTTPTGQIIDRYLKREIELDDRAVHLLFSANRWESMKSMRETLASGTTILSDRYAYSGVAYSAAKGLNLQWCKSPDQGLIAPDAVIYLEVPTETAASRGDFGNERYETMDLQGRVRVMFENLKEPSWKILDAHKPIDALAEQVQAIVSETMERVADEPIHEDLWL